MCNNLFSNLDEYIDLTENKEIIYIDMVVIKKEYRNCGYGNLITNKFLETCKIKFPNISKYFCLIMPNDWFNFVTDINLLFKFYEKYGFEKIYDYYEGMLLEKNVL